MNLQRFIEETLVEIVTGVTSAQTKLQGSGAIINPFLVGSKGHPIEPIKFDVAVEASTGSETKGGGGINVLGGLIGANGEMGVVERENRVSRISFSVSICLPPPAVNHQKGE